MQGGTAVGDHSKGILFVILQSAEGGLDGLFHPIGSLPGRSSQPDSVIFDSGSEEKCEDAGQSIGFSSTRASGNEGKPLEKCGAGSRNLPVGFIGIRKKLLDSLL